MKQHLTVLRLISAAAFTTTETGSATDLQGYIEPGGRNVKITVDCGSNLGTTPSLTVSIQDSDTTTAGDFVDLYTGFAPITATTGGQQTAHIVTNKRYLRAIATLTSDTTQTIVGVQALVTNRFT